MLSNSNIYIFHLMQFVQDGSGGMLNINRVKYAYQRPIFLQLFTDDEIQVIILKNKFLYLVGYGYEWLSKYLFPIIK